MAGLIVVAVFVAVALVVPRYGADTRPGEFGPRRTVSGDLRTLWTRVAHHGSRPSS